MNAITETTTTTLQTQAISQDLFTRFINYVDRPGKTAKTYLGNLKQFYKWLQARNITSPTREDVMAYRDDLAQSHKASTVKGYLQAVKLFFTWTESEGIYKDIARNVHAPKIDYTTHRKGYLKAEDLAQVESTINNLARSKIEQSKNATKDAQGRTERATEQGARLKAMYLLTVNCGLRTIELSRANIEDVEMVNGVPYIFIQGKGHTEKDQQKAMAIEVYDTIKEYLGTRKNTRGNAPLFVTTGNRSQGNRIDSSTISKMLKKAMVKSGYASDRLTAHSLRHSTGQAVMELTNNNLYETQFYMRHQNPSTTEIYIHTDRTERESAMAQDLYNYVHNGKEAQKLTATSP